MLQLDDTIVAIASPSGGSAEGIVRLSGPAVAACLAACFRPSEANQPGMLTSACSVIGEFHALGVHSPISCRLYHWPSRHSYTGQPAAELHTLGSPPLLQAIVRSLCTAGSRLAERGEFTLRAFLSGRIDLTQAEAVLGVIDSVSEANLHVALSQLAGGLAEPLRRLRGDLLDLLADIEAGLDFTDEDIRFIAPEEMTARLGRAGRQLQDLAAQLSTRGETGPLLRVVLTGRPNVGKSSLFNRLAGQGQAIVSDSPGTTRDYLVAQLDLEGVRCLLVDTAGISTESAANVPPNLQAIDQMAEAASYGQCDQAQIRVLCLDATQPADLQDVRELANAARGETIIVLTKADMHEASPLLSSLGDLTDVQNVIAVSSRTGSGLPLLCKALRRVVTEATGHFESVPATAMRCGQSVRLATESIARATLLLQDDAGEELLAAEIRLALQEIGRVVGAVYTDDVLDRVFSRFCVGK